MRSGPPAVETDSAAEPAKELGFRERIIAAAGASVVSAFVVNPLDVVKTRMQAQAAGAGPFAAAATSTPHNVLLEKFAFTTCPETCPRWASPELAAAAAARPQPVMSQSTLASMRHIARTEGMSQLWRGTDMALLMAVPMVGIYMPLYDYAKGALQPELGSSLAPLTAGALSRTAAVLCTAPLDLLRTRMQAMLKHTHLQPAVAGAPAAAASRTSQWMEIIRHVQAGSGSGTTARVGALWTGVGATLARDVPFSALYWALLEPVRSFLLPTPQPRPSASVQSSSQPAPTAGPTYRPHPSVRPPAGPANESQIVSLSAPDASGAPEEASRSCDQQVSASGRTDREWAAQQQGAHVGVQHPAGPPSASSHAHSPPHSEPAESSSDWRGHAGDSRGSHWQSQSHPGQQGSAFDGQDQHSRDQLQQESRAAAASGLEDMKTAGLKDRGDVQVGSSPGEDGIPKVRLLLANLVAGAVGGSAAAALTQPLDVVKTRAQLGHHGRSTTVLQALRELAREGGVKALFTGVTPRALKAAPACAIVLASYETLKAVYADS